MEYKIVRKKFYEIVYWTLSWKYYSTLSNFDGLFQSLFWIKLSGRQCRGERVKVLYCTYLEASFNAPLSLSVVCLISEKFLSKDSQLYRKSNKYRIYEYILQNRFFYSRLILPLSPSNSTDEYKTRAYLNSHIENITSILKLEKLNQVFFFRYSNKYWMNFLHFTDHLALLQLIT